MFEQSESDVSTEREKNLAASIFVFGVFGLI